MTNSLETTTTVGYFNPNTHVIAVQDNNLGINLTLNKGQFIVDGKGRKINDPAFDSMVGPHLLAKQITVTPVPLLRLAKPDQIAPVYPVTASMGVHRDNQNRPVQTAQAFPLQVHEAPKHPVVGMSIAEAKRRGLLATTRTTDFDKAPTFTEDPTGQKAKSIMTPTFRGQSDSLTESSSAVAQAPTIKQLVAANPDPTDPIEQPVATPSNVAYIADSQISNSSDTWANLPQPKDISEEPSEPEKKSRYLFDGKAFDYKSQLKQHLQRKFKNSWESIYNDIIGDEK